MRDAVTKSGHFPESVFNWPIMMPAQDVTLADSDDWGRVHRLDQLNRKKPAKLLGYQALTLIKGASRFWPVFSFRSGIGNYSECQS